jgi:hypothetical protein
VRSASLIQDLALMSEFRVETTTVSDHAFRLASIAPEIAEVSGRLSRAGGAAANTPAHGAVSDVTSQLSAGLGGFGAAAEALQRAMLAAAAEYARTDANVGSWSK